MYTFHRVIYHYRYIISYWVFRENQTNLHISFFVYTSYSTLLILPKNNFSHIYTYETSTFQWRNLPFNFSRCVYTITQTDLKRIFTYAKGRCYSDMKCFTMDTPWSNVKKEREKRSKVFFSFSRVSFYVLLSLWDDENFQHDPTIYRNASDLDTFVHFDESVAWWRRVRKRMSLLLSKILESSLLSSLCSR